MNEAQKEKSITNMFEWMDKDKSGKVSRREFKSAIIAVWHGKCPPHILDSSVNFMTETNWLLILFIAFIFANLLNL